MAVENKAVTAAKPVIGVALGSGAARGWAHIGVLHELAEMGIKPDIVAGCSIGAVVGAAYAAHNLDKLEKWVTSVSRLELVRFFELKISLNGFVRKDRLQPFFHEYICSEKQSIEGLRRKFATVATSLGSGREIWFTEGKVIDAVWASIALPGLFPPVQHEAQWLVDGGLVNPVPVSLCRAMGADIVIAVNLNGNIARRHFARQTANNAPVTSDQKVEATDANSNTLVGNVTASLREYSAALFSGNGNKTDANAQPSLMEAIAGSINIMQDKITRSRMAGDPPEVLLNPRLEGIGLMDFHRGSEAIAKGRECVQRMRADIQELTQD